jgi:hypothetical protein
VSSELIDLSLKVSKIALIGAIFGILYNLYTNTPHMPGKPLKTKNLIDLGIPDIPIQIFIDENEGPSIKAPKWLKKLVKPAISGVLGLIGKRVKLPLGKSENEEDGIVKEFLRELVEREITDEFELDQNDLDSFDL